MMNRKTRRLIQNIFVLCVLAFGLYGAQNEAVVEVDGQIR